jgi:hypothetical protein
VARAKLSAVIRFREQLASRPSVGHLYQGYPFDRLRNRLTLEPIDANSVDAEDLASAPARTLEGLDPTSLAETQLASAFESSNGLRDDRLAARFAVELSTRPAAARRLVDLIELAACLVRFEMSQGSPDSALNLIERIGSEATESEQRTLSTWKAEILARTGRVSEAVAIYQDLVDRASNRSVAALDAAETLLDNRASSEARAFFEIAAKTASEAGFLGVESRAKTWLQST